MEELLYFPAWMLAFIPQVIAILKTWVPVLWREILAGVIAAIATAYVIVTTDLTLGPGIQEGILLFLLLTGTRAGVNGSLNLVKGVAKGVPVVASKDVVKTMGMIVCLLVSAVFVGKVLAQDSTLVDPIKETVKQTGQLWILLASQYLARGLEWLIKKKLG